MARPITAYSHNQVFYLKFSSASDPESSTLERFLLLQNAFETKKGSWHPRIAIHASQRSCTVRAPPVMEISGGTLSNAIILELSTVKIPDEGTS